MTVQEQKGAMPKRHYWLVANLMAQYVFGLLALTVCVPSMQEWPATFGTSQAKVQLTLSGYVAAYGILQLVHGALSDRIGRKPVLLAGLGVAFVGSALAAAASDLWMLIAARMEGQFRRDGRAGGNLDGGGLAGIALAQTAARTATRWLGWTAHWLCPSGSPAGILVRWLPDGRIMLIGHLCAVTSVVLVLALGLAGLHTPLGLSLPLVLLGVGHGLLAQLALLRTMRGTGSS